MATIEPIVQSPDFAGDTSRALSDIDTDLKRARARALNGLMLAGVLVGSVAYFVGLWRAIAGGGSSFRFLVLAPIIFFGWLLYISRRVPHQWRAGLVVLLITAVGIEDFFGAGLSGSLRTSLLLGVFLLVGLISVRAGMIGYGVAVVTIAGLSYGVVNKWIALPANLPDPTLTAFSPTVVTLRYLSGSLALAFTVDQLLGSLIEALARQKALTDQLAAEREATAAMIEKRARALRLVAELASQFRVVAPADLVATLVDRIQDALGFAAVQVYLLDPTGGHLVRVDAASDATDQAKIAFGEGLVGQAAAAAMSGAEEHVPADKPSSVAVSDGRAEAAQPIFADGTLFGVLHVSAELNQALTEEDMALLRAVANQIGIAVQNARLFARIEMEAARENSINRIRRQLSVSPDLGNLARVTATEIGKVVPARSGAVFLEGGLSERGVAG